MADTHGHAQPGHSSAHDDHDHTPEEEVVRTPLWLPFLGLGLLLLGTVSSYLWIYPGVRSASANADAGVEASAEGGAAQPEGAGAAGQPAHPPHK